MFVSGNPTYPNKKVPTLNFKFFLAISNSKTFFAFEKPKFNI